MTVSPDYCSECIVPDAWTQDEEIPESDTVDVTDDSWIKLDIESLPSVKSDDFLRSYHSHSTEQTSFTPILGAEGQAADYRVLKKKLQLLDTIQMFPGEIYQHAMLPHKMAVLEELRSGNVDKTFQGSSFQDVGPQPEFCIPQSPKSIGQSTSYTSLKSGSEPICIVQSKWDQSQTGSQENVKDTDTESIQMKRTFSRQGPISLSSKNKSLTLTVNPSVKDEDFNQDGDNQLKSRFQHGKCYLISTFNTENVVSEEDEEDQNEVCLNQHHTEVSIHSENLPPVTSSQVNMPFNVEQIYSCMPAGHVIPGDDIAKQKGVKIKGMQDGCKLAKVAVAEMAKSVFTIEHVMVNKVGLTELLQGSTGRDKLGSIEVRWKCFIVMKNANKPDTWQPKVVTGNNTSGSVDDEDQSPMSMDWQRSSENGSDVVYFGKIRVSVIKGELAKQKVDVIVNSTSPKLELNTGAVSKTILSYGGASIQKECFLQYPNGIIPGQVVVTNGGDLRCTKVYHGCLSTYDGSPQGKSVMQMETFFSNCLSTADQSNFQSMAFPALGTGNLRFPPDLVAKLMLSCIKSYSDTKRKQASLKNILLVVYPSDINTTQAFMAVVGGTTVQSASSDKNASLSSNITIVPGMCQCKFPGFVAMEIVQGDITKETTDAIVNSVLPDLDLTKGQVSYAILKAGGDSIQQECRVKVGDVKVNGFAITNAGILKCKRIIHMVAKDKREDWEDMIKKVLFKADKLFYQSVSFPALGTGGKGLSPETIAQAMYSACAEFAKSRPNSLKQIRVVLFQDTMWTTFVEAIKVHSSGWSESKTVARLPRTREKMSSLVLSITADSKFNAQSAIRDIESFVKSEIMEREINSPREIISNLLNRQVTKMELMGQGKAMVSVNQRKGIILVSGAPKEVLDTYDRVMKYLRNIEIDKMKENQEKLIKQQEMNDLRLPVFWTRMTNDENLKCVSLNPNGQEYIDVSQMFLASAGSAGKLAVMKGFGRNYGSPRLTVIKIERVQNKSLYQQYKARKRQLEQQNNGQANEKELWHGTAGTNVMNINHNGFNRSYSGSGSHGDGTYFAVNASYSVNGYCRVDASRHRHIYLAHVMTGDSIVLGPGTRVLPPKDPRNPHITYDSTTDNMANPQMFVIFHDTQAYPSYHITFR